MVRRQSIPMLLQKILQYKEGAIMAILSGLLDGLLVALAFVGATILTGTIIGLLNKLYYKILGPYAYKVCIGTGFIGTPIHELGHAFFCLVFGHKIVEIKLYQPSSDDGTLGYVSHSYNKKNFYHRLGNFFIGVGPIIFGSGVILLLMFLLSRDTFKVFLALSDFYTNSAPAGADQYFQFIVGGLSIFFGEFFKVANIKLVTWWIFIILCLLIGTHMSLSKPDISGALSGLLFTVLIFFLVPVIASFFGKTALDFVFGKMMTAAIFMWCIYVIVIALAIFNLGIAGLIRLILKIVKKR